MSTILAYEDVEAKYETEETPESTILTVHIPDGFSREHIGAKVEYDVRRVRVHGERALAKNKRARFNALYQVPEYCDINKIKGKFDGKTVVITIATIPEKIPKPEPQPTQQETEPTPKEDEKEGTPTDDDQEKTSANESNEEVDHETTTSPKAKEESMDQKGQEGISQKGTKVESSTPQEVTEDSKDQKGQDGITSKDAKVDSEKQVGNKVSTSTPPKDTTPQKGQEAIPPKDTFTTDAKLQGEEKFEGETHENEEKQGGFVKNETENHSKETLESRKPHEEEGKEENKGLATFEGEKGREINGKIGNDVEKKSDKKAMPESTKRTRISQAMTSLTKRLNEEDKQRIIYMGAAVLVVALGVYATYKLRSHRP